jgi:hypothetical protein
MVAKATAVERIPVEGIESDKARGRDLGDRLEAEEPEDECKRDFGLHAITIFAFSPKETNLTGIRVAQFVNGRNALLFGCFVARIFLTVFSMLRRSGKRSAPQAL